MKKLITKTDDGNYYRDQINKIYTAGLYPPKLQVSDGDNKTNWLNLNPVSAPIISEWLRGSFRAPRPTVFISEEEAIKDGNSTINQDIKAKLVDREVYCNVNALAEFCLKMSEQDNDAPFTVEDIENFYSYPEWSKTVQGEDLYFEGGSEDKKEEFLENFDRLKDASEELLADEKISTATHERNLELIEEAREEFNKETQDQDAAEIFEWWAVDRMLYESLMEEGCTVVTAGHMYIWGRQGTGQAILLDGVITRIAAKMKILHGQENAWS